MFTGIIEEIGTVKAVDKTNNAASLSITCNAVLENTKIGDSIAVNGVCLTVTKLLKSGFTADIMPETMNRSSLNFLTIGKHVNLERAMAANGRFGGHIVSGHIDGMGVISEIINDENAVWYKIKADTKIMKYIIEKGSITVDGISLTVAKISPCDFSISIIPHTKSQTILSDRRIGDKVNLENDSVAKYVERLLSFKDTEDTKPKKITKEFLSVNGF